MGKICTLYGSHELGRFIDSNGKPKKVSELLEAIQKRYGSGDSNAIDSVIKLLDDDNLILITKLFAGLKK